MLLAPFYMIFSATKSKINYTERPKSRFFGIQDEAHHYQSKFIPFLSKFLIIRQSIKNKKRNCANSRNVEMGEKHFLENQTETIPSETTEKRGEAEIEGGDRP